VINPVGPSSHLEKKKEKNKTYEVKAKILLGFCISIQDAIECA
jgi:hypothetical protein